MTRSRTTSAVLLSAAALLAGCGSDARSGALTGTPFARAAGPILCERSDAISGGALGQLFSGDDDPAAAGRRILPALQRAYDRLRALTPPPGERAAVRGVLDDMGAALAVAEADPARLDSDDDPMTPVDARLAELGLGGCL